MQNSQPDFGIGAGDLTKLERVEGMLMDFGRGPESFCFDGAGSGEE